MHRHVRERSHYLLFGRQLGTFLELKVTNGTGQGQVAIDTSEVDEATGGADTGFLACGEKDLARIHHQPATSTGGINRRHQPVNSE